MNFLQISDFLLSIDLVLLTSSLWSHKLGSTCWQPNDQSWNLEIGSISLTPKLVRLPSSSHRPLKSGYHKCWKITVISPLAHLLNFAVMSTSKLLHPLLASQQVGRSQGFLCRVKIILVAWESNEKKKPFYLCVGPIAQLAFDASRWAWPDWQLLHQYTAKRERFLLNPRHHLKHDMAEKWTTILPTSFIPNWMEIWNCRWSKKEVGFIWSIYHGAVATNVWWACISNAIDPSCTCCNAGLPKTLLHQFHQCNITIHAWRYAMTLLFSYANIQPHREGCWPGLTWQQCLIGSPLPNRLQVGKNMWSLLRGSVLWITWLDRNAFYFNANSWPTQELEQVIWEALKDHAHVA